MSERGFIAVDRGLWDDPDFPNEPFSEREAWLWLIAEAAWEDKRVRVGSAVINLERGQCCYSTRFLAAKWHWSEASVRRFIEKLKKRSQIVTQAREKGDALPTQLTICNYDKFQASKSKRDAGKTQARRKEEQANKPSNEGNETADERVVVLQSVLDEEHAVAVHEHRLIKQPKTWTPKAAGMMAKELARARDLGIEPNLASEAIIRNGWTGFEVGWLANSRLHQPRLVHSAQRAPPAADHKRDRLKAMARGDELSARPFSDPNTIEGEFQRSRRTAD